MTEQQRLRTKTLEPHNSLLSHLLYSGAKERAKQLTVGQTTVTIGQTTWTRARRNACLVVQNGAQIWVEDQALV